MMSEDRTIRVELPGQYRADGKVLRLARRDDRERWELERLCVELDTLAGVEVSDVAALFKQGPQPYLALIMGAIEERLSRGYSLQALRPPRGARRLEAWLARLIETQDPENYCCNLLFEAMVADLAPACWRRGGVTF